MTLNETRKRIKIADLIGWTCMETHNEQLRGYPPNFDPDSQCSEIDYEVPDYFHDLEAMHEAEKTLPDIDEDGKDKLGYAELLAHSIGASWSGNNGEDMWRIVHATAAQRAEAFGQVKGLW